MFTRRPHHDQGVQVRGADVKSVRRPCGTKNDFACARGQDLAFAIQIRFAFEHVEGLVLPLVDARGRLGAGLYQGEATTGILALGEKRQRAAHVGPGGVERAARGQVTGASERVCFANSASSRGKAQKVGASRVDFMAALRVAASLERKAILCWVPTDPSRWRGCRSPGNLVLLGGDSRRRQSSLFVAQAFPSASLGNRRISFPCVRFQARLAADSTRRFPSKTLPRSCPPPDLKPASWYAFVFGLTSEAWSCCR